jgi:hypothetical protein
LEQLLVPSERVRKELLMPLTETQRSSLDGKGIDWNQVTYVEPDQVLDALARGGAQLVDARHGDDYQGGHPVDAVHWRWDEPAQLPPQGKELYLYCT